MLAAVLSFLFTRVVCFCTFQVRFLLCLTVSDVYEHHDSLALSLCSINEDHLSVLSHFSKQAAGLSLSNNIDGVIIGDSVDEFVIRIDASACRHLVNDDLKDLVCLSDLFLLEIEWLLLVLLTNKNTNVDGIV